MSPFPDSIMTGHEFAAWRTELGLSTDDVAQRLGVTPALVQKWEDGRVAIAQRFEDALPFVSYSVRAKALLETSGLPLCPVAAAFEQREADAEASAEESSNALRDYMQHTKHCPVCQARERYVVERLGPMPRPQLLGPWYARAFGVTAAKIMQLPDWLQPAAWGAVILFALTAVRVVFILPRNLLFHGLHGSAVAKAALMPFIVAVGGATGGFGYTLLGKPLRRVPVVGAYLAGIVTAYACLLPLWWILSVLDPKSAGDSADAGVMIGSMVVAGVILGLIVGHTWFAADDTDRAHDAARKARGAAQLG